MSLDLDVIPKIFRENQDFASQVVSLIHKYAEELKSKFGDEPIKIMNFCGTHEWTITHYGLRSLMPPNVELIAGPGCPVCVTPSSLIEEAIKLSRDGIIVYTYGDGFRLPTTQVRSGYVRSLKEAKALGADVRVVYSFLDAVKDAREHGKPSVFLGIGFETTSPSYSLLIKEGKVPANLAFMSAIRLTPPAQKFTIKLHTERGLLPIRGVIAPGHVSAVVGAKSWAFLPRDFNLPTVVSGFEPIDVLLSVLEILKMLKNGEAKLVNEYKRLVSWEGNVYAQQANKEVFEEEMSVWRGIGYIPRSGLRLKEAFKRIDAYEQYGVKPPSAESAVLTNATVKLNSDVPPGCRCGEVTVGIAKPTDCPMFMKTCTPDRPWGPCMASSEGTCRVWATSGIMKKVMSSMKQGGA